jgi:hypothetical protein
MELIKEKDIAHHFHREFKYIMELSDPTNATSDCYIKEGIEYRPDPLSLSIEYSSTDVFKDYALIMKLPNLFSPQKTGNVMLFAGCKVGGQCGITEWFSDPQNLAYLTNKFYSKYFQILFEVKYNFARYALPKIISVTKLKEEEIFVNQFGD